MLFNPKSFVSFIVLVFLISNSFSTAFGQMTANQTSFEKVQLMVSNGKKIREEDVRVRFLDEAVQIETVAGGKVLKTFK